jgi:hypothetical protein
MPNEKNQTEEKNPEEKNPPREKESGQEGSSREDEGARYLTQEEHQEELNRVVSDRLERARRKIEKETRERLEKEAREKRLLENEEFRTLAEEREREAAEYKARLEQYERNQKVSALLDKKGVTNPEFRKVFLNLIGDDGSPIELEELDERVSGFDLVFRAAVEEEVNKRIGTKAPPKGESKERSQTKPARQMSTAEKVAFIAEHGRSAWQEKIEAEAISARNGAA